MTARQFQHEDIAAVPKGWRVRTVKHGAHEVRVAFPPGPRKTGSGKLISILHPIGENPLCNALRFSNPAELVLMGANPGKKKWIRGTVKHPGRLTRAAAHAGMPIHAYAEKHKHDPQGTIGDAAREYLAVFAPEARNPLRMVNSHFTEDEKLTLGRLGIKWTGIQSPRDVRKARKALKEAAKIRRQFGNPMSAAEQRERATEIYSGFHATSPKNKIVLDEPHIPAGTYPELGLLVSIKFKPTDKAREAYEKNYVNEKEDIHVIGNLDREEIFFAGGSQAIDEETLRYFGWAGEPDFCLGTARQIVYVARKYHQEVPAGAGRGELVDWVHDFGEENHIRPQFCYDVLNKRIFLHGGDYQIEDRGIVN